MPDLDRAFSETRGDLRGAYRAGAALSQGKDPSLALRIVGRTLLPEGPRFANVDHVAGNLDGKAPLDAAFGVGNTDRARHLASLFVDDLADVLRDGIDPRFELSRYGERLALVRHRLMRCGKRWKTSRRWWMKRWMNWTREKLRAFPPDLVGITVPFPGNVYGALRIARMVKSIHPKARVVLGVAM